MTREETCCSLPVPQIEWDGQACSCYLGSAKVFLLVADDGVELDDGLLLLGCEGPALDVRPEVVGPPQSAALAAPVQPCMPLPSQK
jgi:hypothetical protein